MSPFKCTLDTKLRWFQFRLTHRILGVNSFLAKIGKIESNLCTFCNVSDETIAHIFCECPIVSDFWRNVAAWIKEEINLNFILDAEMKLFGIANIKRGALNIILLLCLYFIYKKKMQKGILSINIFQKEVRQFFSLEKYIFTKNGNISTFNRKWDNYLQLVTS